MSHFDITRVQSKAWSLLAGSVASGRVASTYLFCGAEGLGDWPLAVEFAALLNCPTPIDERADGGLMRPCGECSTCRSIRGLNHESLQIVVPIPKHKNADEAVDLANAVLARKREEPFELLDTSSPLSISIEMARQVKKTLSRKGAEGITRVVVFYQMETMRASSADALLKLIEEPPPDTVLILTTARSEGLLPTIQSRAQKIRLERVPENLAVRYLQEHYQAGDTRARLSARLSDGNLGRAIELAASDDSADSSDRAVGLLLFRTLFTESNPAVIGQAFDLLNPGDRGALEEMLRLWQTLIRDCAFYAGTGDEEALINIDFVKDVRNISRNFNDSSLAGRLTDTIKNALADLRLNVHIQPALVALLLRLRADIAAAGASAVQE
ncbi:MAG: hypothetical protein KKA42_05500 [candidate division Zixibacteria bacterium]|nr:hypothetical protein [candidate division Zixibacteria bacterium]